MFPKTPQQSTWKGWVRMMTSHISALNINLFVISLCHYLFHLCSSSTKKEQNYQASCLIGFIGSLISLNRTYALNQVEYVGTNKLGNHRAFPSLLFQFVFIFSYKHRFAVKSIVCKSGMNSLQQQLRVEWRFQRNIGDNPMDLKLGLWGFFAISLGGQHPLWSQLLTLHF